MVVYNSFSFDIVLKIDVFEGRCCSLCWAGLHSRVLLWTPKLFRKQSATKIANLHTRLYWAIYRPSPQHRTTTSLLVAGQLPITMLNWLLIANLFALSEYVQESRKHDQRIYPACWIACFYSISVTYFFGLRLDDDIWSSNFFSMMFEAAS